MTLPKVEVHQNEGSPDAQEIHQELFEHNTALYGAPNRQPIVVSVYEESDLIAGLRGVTHWGWLYISHLWVSPAHRRKQLGKLVMQQAEQEAIKRDCLHCYVDTFSPDAVEFYRSMGYEVYGELEDFPPGNKRYFLKKSLNKSA